MGRRKISTTVYLEPHQEEDLKALARKDRKPFAVLLRDAVDAYLQERIREIPPRGSDPRQAPLDFAAKEARPEIPPPPNPTRGRKESGILPNSRRLLEPNEDEAAG